jgi:hypothetical protein
MATVNKNFRIKHGLVVEGSTATVNGQNILTETGSDQYILDLVGGENLIDSVASGLSVDANSQLSIDRTVVDGWYDSNGAAAAALSDAQDYADTAEADAVTSANAYTDGRETAITTAYEAYADQAEVDAKAYTDTREGAITTAYEAYADQAEVDAKAYTDTREGAITTAYEAYADQAETDAVASAQAALDDVLDGTTAFSEVNLYDLTSQRAVQGFVTTAQEGSSMISWAKSDYGTAKAWVKFATPTHSQISEVLLTTDSTGNISITEFGMVGTNGSLGSVGASYLNGNIAIEVDTVHAATTVTVVATLIK